MSNAIATAMAGHGLRMPSASLSDMRDRGCARPPSVANDGLMREGRLPEPLGQVDVDRVALGLVDDIADVGLDGQLVRAIAQRHERAPERMPIDRAGDLDQTAGPEEVSAPVGYHVGPATLRGAFDKRRPERLVERARAGH